MHHSGAIFRSLRFRLAVWNTLVLLALVAVTLFIVHEALRVVLLRDVDQRLIEDAAEFRLAFAELYPDNEQEIYRDMDRKARSHRDERLFLQLLDREGTVKWESRETPRLPIFDSPVDETLVAESNGYRVAQLRLDDEKLPSFIVRAGCSLELVSDLVAKRTAIMAWVGGAIVLLAPFGGFWLAGRATRPLASVIATAERLRPTPLDERLPLTGAGDELDRLAQTVNHFLDQLAEYLDRHREFVANAAHELRSPLAAIQSSIEVALNADRTTDEYKDLLYSLVEQCSSLTVLVNQLLQLAEADGGRPEARFADVSLEKVAATSLEMFRPAAEERGIELLAELNGAPIVRGDAGRLRQVVNNLIDNSLKFTPAGGTVKVALHGDPKRRQAVLEVSDTGEGIPAADLPHVFDRFYRGDKSRQRQHPTHGNGLGLSICQSIVDAHGGTISVVSEPGGGTRFEVRLAAARK